MGVVGRAGGKFRIVPGSSIAACVPAQDNIDLFIIADGQMYTTDVKPEYTAQGPDFHPWIEYSPVG